MRLLVANWRRGEGYAEGPVVLAEALFTQMVGRLAQLWCARIIGGTLVSGGAENDPARREKHAEAVELNVLAKKAGALPDLMPAGKCGWRAWAARLAAEKGRSN